MRKTSLDLPPAALKGTPITRRRLWLALIPSAIFSFVWIATFISQKVQGTTGGQHWVLLFLAIFSGGGIFVISMVLSTLLLCKDRDRDDNNVMREHKDR